MKKGKKNKIKAKEKAAKAELKKKPDLPLVERTNSSTTDEDKQRESSSSPPKQEDAKESI